MKRILIGLLCFALFSQPVFARQVWVSGYYPGWVQEQLPPDKLPLDALTHLFHFAAIIHPDGTFTVNDFGLSDAHIAATVNRAHKAGKKVLIVLGGAGSGAGFRGATTDANRAKFIAAIQAFVAKHHYDGVDLDWEPMSRDDNAQYKVFVRELHTALKQQNAKLMLTAATGPDPLENPDLGKVYAELQQYFDQINLMTYVLSGAWPGWFSWFGSPLYNGGLKFSTGRDLPSIETNSANFVASGVHANKLGIGLAFHGDVWTGGSGTATGGVTGPRQQWKTPPTVKSDVYYREIMQKFYTPERAHFDKVTQTPYLSIDQPGSAQDVFVSYCDAGAITSRLKFMKQKGYGGCIIWHVGQDLLPSGQQPLAKAIATFRAQNSK